MRYRKLDSNGDMLFGNQQADFFRDQAEAVAQAVWTRLRLWVGEWFVDTTEGTPYQQAVLGTNKRKTVEPAMRRRILNTEGVTNIEEFQMLFDPDNRVVTINAVINTAYGSAQLQGVI
jgi:hypothetical protein